MNWAAVAAITSLIGVAASFGLAAFVYGQLTQSVADTKAKTDNNTTRLDGHDTRLGEHDVKIGKIEEWKAGIHIAPHIRGQQ